MKEDKKRRGNFLDSLINFVTFLLLGFMSFVGFVFGAISLFFIFSEKNIDISPIYISFDILIKITSFLILLLVIKVILWFFKKFFVPQIEKSREKKKQEFINTMKEIFKPGKAKNGSTRNKSG